MPTRRKGYDEPLAVGGHEVQVVEVDGVQRLYIDGIRRRYITTPNGFVLREAIYQAPTKTLLEAGTRHAEQLAGLRARPTTVEES